MKYIIVYLLEFDTKPGCSIACLTVNPSRKGCQIKDIKGPEANVQHAGDGRCSDFFCFLQRSSSHSHWRRVDILRDFSGKVGMRSLWLSVEDRQHASNFNPWIIWIHRECIGFSNARQRTVGSDGHGPSWSGNMKWTVFRSLFGVWLQGLYSPIHWILGNMILLYTIIHYSPNEVCQNSPQGQLFPAFSWTWQRCLPPHHSSMAMSSGTKHVD